MLYPNSNGRPPSLLVEDGETVTVGATGQHAEGLSVLKLRPRTTAALLTLAGMTPRSAPRLSDRAAFESIERTEGFVNLAAADRDGRIAGYSVPYLRGVFEALDPARETPARTVLRRMPADVAPHDCGCSGKKHAATHARGVAAAVAQAAASTSANAGDRYVQAHVPDFVTDLKIYSLFTVFSDIVVGRNSTLILNPDVMLAMADNVLCHEGSRVVQRASYLNIDITGRLRGTIVTVLYKASDYLTIDLAALGAEPATKP